MVHKLGAHLSIAGGFHNALHKISKIGGNSLQVFASSPRSWALIMPTADQIQLFNFHLAEYKIDPVYFHASYLVNLANDFEATVMARRSIIHDLELALQMNVKGTIVHLGSFKQEAPSLGPESHLIRNIKDILVNTPEETYFIIENAGNKKIGQSLEEIAEIIKVVDSPRLKVCIDTCHAYSAGHDLSTPEKLDTFIETFDKLIGLDRLEVIHFNDSKDPFNSGRDRHENIGKGTLGIETFRLMLNHPKLKHLPFIIETPGFDDKGPDKENLDILKSLII